MFSARSIAALSTLADRRRRSPFLLFVLMVGIEIERAPP
jgi:hypothetical protein